MIKTIQNRFKETAPKADFCNLRYVHEKNQLIFVRQNILQPVKNSEDCGVMITVYHKGGMGYAGTCDLSERGLRQAGKQALEWAQFSVGRTLIDFSDQPNKSLRGEYQSSVKKTWDSISLKEKINLLQQESRKLKSDSRIVDWQAWLANTEIESYLIDLEGGVIHQHFNILVPNLSATANEGTETQTRSFGGMRSGRQGGPEILDEIGFYNAAERIGKQAIELLQAPNCPTGNTELLLAPDQMILQIHESIGHPLELDRILGDERNYAGTSFVSLDMFGKYQYGSNLLNIIFDPSLEGEMASYAYDDDGTTATKEYIIKAGILQRPLGGSLSQLRADMPGVANARATSWNRPPIDRMANLNLEPGTSSFDEMLSSVEKGIYMESNCSWSIDDSRNKFQFGCEYARLIENGHLGHVLKNPNYRGISATFWRNLKMLGNQKTAEILGTANCGKGEPNQTIRVGHASPTALFADVEVFGGA